MINSSFLWQAIVSIRLFLLSLIRPIRASVRTNIQVVQSTTLLKYRSLFRFLRRQAPKAADEVQRAYVVSARAYYETCFRRYARSLGVIRVCPFFVTPYLLELELIYNVGAEFRRSRSNRQSDCIRCCTSATSKQTDV